MVERYIKTVEEHLREVVSSNQKDWDAMLPLSLLDYGESTHDTTGFTPANLLFGRELRLPSDLLFGTPPDKERPTIEHAANLVDHLRDIHNYARQHLRLASNRMKTLYDKLSNCAGYQESDRVWLYRPTRSKGRAAKLQSSWEGPYKIIRRINDVVYRIQRSHRSRMMVVHLDRLAPYRGAARDDRS
jgi:hypothetical protein